MQHEASRLTDGFGADEHGTHAVHDDVAHDPQELDDSVADPAGLEARWQIHIPPIHALRELRLTSQDCSKRARGAAFPTRSPELADAASRVYL